VVAGHALGGRLDEGRVADQIQRYVDGRPLANVITNAY